MDIDFLLIYPYDDFQAYSQRVLLGELSRASYNVHLLFVSDLEDVKSKPEVKERFLTLVKRARVVGFSFMSLEYPIASYLTKLIKENHSAPVIWGGAHSTIAHKELKGEVDAVFVGESEVVLRQYLQRVLENEEVGGIPQVVFPDQDLIPAMKDSFVTDIDNLGMPFYEIDKQSFISKEGFHDSPDFFKKNFHTMDMVTSRGCAYSCTYCANSYLKKNVPQEIKRIRKRSIKNIIGEIELCRSIYDINSIIINDDFFMARSKDELTEFVQEYKEKVGLKIAITGITPSCVRPDKIDIISQLPLSYIRIGVQTNSNNGLAVYKRNPANSNQNPRFECLKPLARKIPVQYDIILDNPFEGQDDYLETLKYVMQLPKPLNLNLHHLTFYQGTELRKSAIEHGHIDDADNEYITRHYVDLDDNYINNLFLLYNRSSGLIPRFFFSLLTCRFIMNSKFLKARFNSLVKVAARCIHPLRLGYIYRKSHSLFL